MAGSSFFALFDDIAALLDDIAVMSKVAITPKNHFTKFLEITSHILLEFSGIFSSIYSFK